MPAVIHSTRDRSAVGRFPTVTFGSVEDEVEEKEKPNETDEKKESACQQWLRKACKCCYRQPSDDHVPLTVDPTINDLEKKDETNKEKPTTGERDLNGN